MAGSMSILREIKKGFAIYSRNMDKKIDIDQSLVDDLSDCAFFEVF